MGFFCGDWDFVLVLYDGKSEEGICILPAIASRNLNLLALPIFPVLVSSVLIKRDLNKSSCL